MRLKEVSSKLDCRIMEKHNKKVALVILDGWGIGKKDNSDAIANARTPFADSLSQKYPNARLRTDGEHVGLPDGQMGNSEVGHMNIGAGRVVFQELVRINKNIRERDFFSNPTLLAGFEYAQKNKKTVHLIGLISDGGVHSHWLHAAAICEMASHFPEVVTRVHAITDGRDTDPQSGLGYIQAFEGAIESTGVKIASVIGRYFAMDRDKRWERIKKSYDLMTQGIGTTYSNATAGIKASYEKEVTDEFIEPIIVDSQFVPISEGDVVICFNYRTDRCREITEVLSQHPMPDFNMTPIPALHYITMTQYDEKFKNIHVVFQKDNLIQTLGEVISHAGKSQLRIAETEKYPHVTFFFSGGREEPFDKEQRGMIPSPKVATYDLMPEMSAQGILEKTKDVMAKETPDFICLNFANPDMVGHTGVWEAIIKAVETVDQCLKELVEFGIQQGYQFVIIADHGNADKAINEDGSPNTAHTTNPVPVWIISDSVSTVKDGILADVAPTILHLMDIKKPIEMTGSLLM
jgi:2,3-bisphosphoglycerate-independent phosphoglycerate mutase